MSEWREYILEDCMDAIIDYRGKTPNKTTSGIPLITAKIIKNGSILPTQEYIAENDYESWMRRGIPEVGDVLLTTEAPLGEVAQISDPNIALAQRVITLRSKKEFLNNDFLKYLLISPQTQSELAGRSSGTTVLGIKQSELRKVKLIIPEYPVQAKIAGILKSLDDKIELNRKMNETLEEMARTIFKSWFVDFDPVHAKARGEKPAGMPDEIADLFPSEFVHSDQLNKPIPKGWDVVPLKNLIDFNPSRQLKSGSIAPYVEMSNLPEQGMSIKDFYYREFKSGSRFMNGDTLFARITPCLENGKTAYVDCFMDGEVGWGSTEFIVMRSKADIGNYFSYLIARSDWFRTVAIASMTGSSGRQRASKEALEELLIAAPCLDVFKAFNGVIDKIPEKIKSAHSENQTLAELRDSLLPKLISGEIVL